MSKYLKNEQGSSLAFLLVALVVLSIIGIALLNTSLGGTKVVVYQENTKQAYYLARSGADSVAYHIINNPTTVNTIKGKTSDVNSSFSNGTFQVEVNELVGGDLELVSTGVVNGIEEAITLILELQNAQGIFQHAVFSNESIDIDGLSHIYGDVGSNGSITGTTTRAPGDEDFPNLGVVYPEPIFPTTLTPRGDYDLQNADDLIDTSGEYGDFSFNGNSHSILTFDTTSGNRRILVDDLYIKGNIDIVGDNTLSIYVNSSAEFQTPRLISDNDPNKVFIYLKAGSELRLAANMEFTGYIYGPGADIEEWSGAEINGAVVADTFSANGNPSITYIEPDTATDVSSSIIMYRKDLWKN